MTDPDTFLETVREENRTPLSRLGSSKSLYAATGGEIDTEPVLEATADAEYAAWQTFDAWAEREPDEAASEAFLATAADEQRHFETVRERLASEYEPTETPALHTYLRDLETTPERVGGFAGRVLASQHSKSQVVGYFVGSADPQSAALFREFGEDLEGQLERVRQLLTDVVDDVEDRERALEAATGAIEAAYGEYVEGLEALGANPKPVC